VRERLGEHPTVKLRQVDVARYAREADKRAVQAEAASRPGTEPKSPSIYPDIEVSVDEANLEDGQEALGVVDPAAEPASVKAETPAGDHSVIRLAPREEEEGPKLTSIPCVVASKEDLSWFQLEESSHVILALIDGESTVQTIADMLTIPRASTLAILRELGSHGVIEFHES
jgi:hypothetical protein